jgi:sugar lactone lactonase YvrE
LARNIYVAAFNPSDPSGRLLAFDENSGEFLREFSPPVGFAYTFHPRGVVIGPNGLLYVSNVPNLVTGLGGQVLVFDPETLNLIGAFVVDGGGKNQLNRPEGLVFGPDGNLYITSFRADPTDPTDTDSIRIYDGRTGVIKGKINLWASGAPRAFAQALLFGPDGKLFVPISGGATAGQVRRYDVADATDVNAATAPPFDEFVPVPSAGTSVLFYLTFGKTDPGTLAYSK